MQLLNAIKGVNMTLIEKLEKICTEYEGGALAFLSIVPDLRAIIEEYKATAQEPVAWRHKDMPAEICTSEHEFIQDYGSMDKAEALFTHSNPNVQPIACIYEDELPSNYPYDEMFEYSKVDGVRMFPVYGPSTHPQLSDETVKDADRYRWLCNNASNSFILTKNDDHKTNYVTAKTWIEEYAPEHFTDDNSDEIQKMKDTDTIWRLQVYPDTPIGFYVWHGATLSYAIDEAMKADND